MRNVPDVVHVPRLVVVLNGRDHFLQGRYPESD